MPFAPVGPPCPTFFPASLLSAVAQEYSIKFSHMMNRGHEKLLLQNEGAIKFIKGESERPLNNFGTDENIFRSPSQYC